MENKSEILIVDDNPFDTDLLGRILSQNGYLVRKARDGNTALKNLRERAPSLVILDVRLPGMNGFEVCQQMKSSESTRHIPVIFISGLEDQIAKVKGFAVGGVDFITKPFENSEVLARVQNHLSLFSLQQQLEEQNTLLQQEISERKRAEIALHEINLELEQKILERTAEIMETNQALRSELQTRKQAEKALRDSEARYRNIVESSPLGMHFYQLEADGRLVFSGANPAAEQILGVDQEQYIGKSIEEAFPELANTDLPRQYRQVARTGIGWHANQVLYTKGDITASFEVHAFQTTPGRMVAAFLEITERVHSEAERERLLMLIREQAQQMSKIMNTVPEGVLLLDNQWKILVANPLAEEYLSRLTDARVGDSLSQLGDRSIGELLALHPQGLWHEVRTGSTLFEVRASPLMDPTISEHWVMVLRDITQEREIQQSIQRQERLAAVGQLAAGIAHDFNNILAVIILYTDMLLGQPELPPKVDERLQTISEQAHLATGMIQQILDFSRRAILERHPMDLLPYVKEQTKLLERTLPENIKIQLNYQDGEYLVNADPTRIQQTLMNLAVNARDAMPEGGELRISLSRKSITEPKICSNCGQRMSGEWVHIHISDTGHGIPPAILSRIFEPFFTTKEPGVGTGLGLSQVYGIVMQHEGHIHVDTTVLKGAAFDIYLPVLSAQSTPHRMTDNGSIYTGQKEFILVVEDEPATQKALVDSLTLLNYRVQAVNDGRQALDFIQLHHDELDLIISDVVMPEMGGIALFRSLKEQEMTTPIILMTGHPMTDELHDLQSEGLTGWVMKPPKLKDLSRVIAQVLAPKAIR